MTAEPLLLRDVRSNNSSVRGGVGVAHLVHGDARNGDSARPDGRAVLRSVPRHSVAARVGEPVGSLWSRLTERDRRIVSLLSSHRVLTTDQLLALEFGSRTRAQHRLVELYRLGVLWRFRFPLVAGGSMPWHYALGYTGARLVAARKAVRPPSPAEHARWLERVAESPKLRHLLGVNDFFTTLAGHARQHGWPDVNTKYGCGLAVWLNEEHAAALHSSGHDDIRPDGYGVWTPPDQQPVGFYVEYDTGTETLTTVADKLDRYTDTQQRSGQPLYGVLLFTVASARREAGLRAAMAAKHCPVPIATTARDLADPHGPAGPVWLPLQPDSNASTQRVTLARLPGSAPAAQDTRTQHTSHAAPTTAQHSDNRPDSGPHANRQAPAYPHAGLYPIDDDSDEVVIDIDDTDL